MSVVADTAPLPIPDRRPAHAVPTSDVRDLLAQCIERQEWYREHARATGEPDVGGVGALDVSTDVTVAAASTRELLAFDVAQRRGSWVDAARRLAANAEDIGVLVMVSGVVGSSSRRKLDPTELSGFTLADRRAPVVFVNGATPRPLHLFVLAHGLAHLWLGESALFTADARAADGADEVERWCNEVAAEVVVPRADLEERFTEGEPLATALQRFVRAYKASAPVLVRRLHDAGLLQRLAGGGDDDYRTTFGAELDRLVAEAEAKRVTSGGGGGNFYNTQPVRVSKRFARTIIASTAQGRTPEPVALRMLGFSKPSTLKELGRRLGVG
jgi:Zn-dependent peptidase ImmA (M78 family)